MGAGGTRKSLILPTQSSDLPPVQTASTGNEASAGARATRIALYAVLVLGAALRIYHYAINRSLWLDEAMLALNVVQRSASHLFDPLAYNQGAPLGFLFGEKLVTTLFGPGERALRALPLSAALTALFLFPAFARRYLRSPHPTPTPASTTGLAPTTDLAYATLLATALFAVSNYLVYYASEAKQYSVDVLACVLLFYLGQPLFRGSVNRRQAFLFAIFSPLAVAVSHASVFVIAAIGATALFCAALERRWRSLGWLILVLLPSALAFGVIYIVSLRGLNSNKVLLDFWRFGMMPFPPWRDLAWFGTTLHSFTTNPLGLPAASAPFILLLALVGVYGFFRRSVPECAALVGVILLTLVVSTMGVYPFAGRLILFLAPVVYLFLAEGVRTIAGAIPRSSLRAAVWIVAGGVLVLASSWGTVQRVQTPLDWREHIRPTMALLAEQMQPGDAIYCYTTACAPFEYYEPMYHLPAHELIRGAYYGQFPDSSLAELDALREKNRVWTLVTHPWPGDDVKIADFMDAIGQRLVEYNEYQITTTLYSIDRDAQAPLP